MNFKFIVFILIVLFILWIIFRNKLKETFEDSDESKTIVYLFKADVCGHCKAFMPEFKKFKDTVLEKNLPVLIKIIDDKDPNLKNIMEENNIEIEGYPTVIFIKNKEKFVYEGPRTQEGLMKKLNELI